MGFLFLSWFQKCLILRLFAQLPVVCQTFCPRPERKKHLPWFHYSSDGSSFLPQDTQKAKQFLPFLQRAGRSEAVVEYVFSGSRLKLYLPKETCLITFLLAGKSPVLCGVLKILLGTQKSSLEVTCPPSHWVFHRTWSPCGCFSLWWRREHRAPSLILLLLQTQHWFHPASHSCQPQDVGT